MVATCRYSLLDGDKLDPANVLTLGVRIQGTMRIVPWSDRKAGRSRRNGRSKAGQTSRLTAASWKVLPLLKLFPELDWVLCHSWHLKASLTDTWGTNMLEVQKDRFCGWLRELEARLSPNLRAWPCLNFIWLVANYDMNLHSTALGRAMHLSQNRASDWSKIKKHNYRAGSTSIHEGFLPGFLL